jgi:hypothetical protein
MPREEAEQTRESRQLQRIFPVSVTKPLGDPEPVSARRPTFISGA